MKVRKMIIGAVCALAVSGCAQTTDRIRSMNWMEVAGTLGGAAIGGYAGAQFGGGLAQTMFTATSVMVGGGIGYIGARMMSQRDQALHNETTHKALASNSPGTPYHWNNPESGHSGMVRTMASYRRSDGTTCQQYRASVVFEDGVASGNGSACMQANGQWLAMNDSFN